LARGRVASRGDRLFDSFVYRRDGVEVEEVRCGICGHLLFVYVFDGASELEHFECFEPCKHFEVVPLEEVRTRAKQLPTIMDRTRFWRRVRCCGGSCYERRR